MVFVRIKCNNMVKHPSIPGTHLINGDIFSLFNKTLIELRVGKCIHITREKKEIQAVLKAKDK